LPLMTVCAIVPVVINNPDKKNNSFLIKNIIFVVYDANIQRKRFKK